jgi:hypothetical protein
LTFLFEDEKSKMEQNLKGQKIFPYKQTNP